ncbi:MAG: hypothetical protein RRY12_08760 [Cloacibacillus sp.]
MDEKKFLEKISDIVEEEEGTITFATELDALEAWDSLARITFLVFAADEFKKRVDGNLVKEAKTVSDLYQLVL